MSFDQSIHSSERGIFYWDHHYQLDSSAWSVAMTGWMNDWLNEWHLAARSFIFILSRFEWCTCLSASVMAFRFHFTPIAWSHLRLTSTRNLTMLLCSRRLKITTSIVRALSLSPGLRLLRFSSFFLQKQPAISEGAKFQSNHVSWSNRTQENDHKSCLLY